MNNEELLKKYYFDFRLCVRCRCCSIGDWPPDYLKICPAFAKFGYFAYTGGGKVNIARALVDHLISYSRDLADVIYKCTTCGACVEACQLYAERRRIGLTDLDTIRLVKILRTELVCQGYGPPSPHKKWEKSIRENKNPYYEQSKHRFEWIPQEATLPATADIVYFVGCTSAYREPQIPQSMIHILKHANVNFTVLDGKEWCCGSPLIRTGQLDHVEELAKHNLEAIEATGATKMIVNCPGCYLTFAEDYPDMGFNPKFEILHSTQFLLELMDKGLLNPMKKVKERVTYHDPCHVSRRFGIYEPPRKIINRVPGVELVEMPRNREYSLCCGAGGGVKSAYPEWALEVAEERVQEAIGTNATSIVTSCPFCIRNLRDALKAINGNVKLLDIAELVNSSLNR